MIPSLLTVTTLAAALAQTPAPGAPPVARAVEPPSAAASLTYLRGFTWRSGPASRDVLTVETAARAARADVFVMTEVRHLTTRTPVEQGTGTFAYIEGHLRWRIGPTVGADPLLLTHEVNAGGGRLAHLHGLGWLHPVAGGAVRVHLYLRDDVDARGVAPQVLVAGSLRRSVRGLPLRLAGYGDLVGAEGDRDGLFYGEVQLLIETSRVGGAAVGVELHHSRALTGASRPVEWVPQLAVQWAF